MLFARLRALQTNETTRKGSMGLVRSEVERLEVEREAEGAASRADALRVEAAQIEKMREVARGIIEDQDYLRRLGVQLIDPDWKRNSAEQQLARDYCSRRAESTLCRRHDGVPFRYAVVFLRRVEAGRGD